MHIDVITCLPKLVESPFSDSILKRAQQKGLVTVNIIDLRQYGIGKHRTTDDYAFGGGAGMVMMIEPIDNCIKDLRAKRVYDEVIYTSPDGEVFTQSVANELSLKQNLILLCGHYKGVDERVRQHLVTREISIGDYVLSGGELPALVVVDAIVRLIPGALGSEESASSDSHSDGLLEYPQYTRPQVYRGWSVPEVLLSGNHGEIAEWRRRQAILRTAKRRPDLLEKGKICEEERRWISENLLSPK